MRVLGVPEKMTIRTFERKESVRVRKDVNNFF